jgi:hypothetical protein
MHFHLGVFSGFSTWCEKSGFFFSHRKFAKGIVIQIYKLGLGFYWKGL